MRIAHCGRHDDLFELGGTSLLAAQLCAKVERITGEKLSLSRFWEAPTVEQLAELLEDREPRGAAAERPGKAAALNL